MILFVSGATTSVRWFHPQRVGVLCVPGTWSHQLDADRIWAGDNGAYLGFEAEPFRRMLTKLAPHRDRCLFMSAPDVVGKAPETAALYEQWAPEIRAAGYRVAYVLQDGCVEIPACEAVFLGGTTAYKLSGEALSLCLTAKARGLWVHVGRVNSRKRIEHFIDVADSIDGGSATKWAMTNIPKLLRFIDQARSASAISWPTWQPSLDLTSPSPVGRLSAVSPSAAF